MEKPDDTTESDVMRANPISIRLMPPGQCAYCDAYRNDPMMPSHTASPRCESGRRNHCTCDICF